MIAKDPRQADLRITLTPMTDRTWEIIDKAAVKDSRIVGVRLMRNHGHQLALTAGLRVCRGERVLIIDADLQDPPELLPDMMALMDEGADVVYGQRRRREGEGMLKRATAALFYRFRDVVGGVRDMVGGVEASVAATEPASPPLPPPAQLSA